MLSWKQNWSEVTYNFDWILSNFRCWRDFCLYLLLLTPWCSWNTANVGVKHQSMHRVVKNWIMLDGIIINKIQIDKRKFTVWTLYFFSFSIIWETIYNFSDLHIYNIVHLSIVKYYTAKKCEKLLFRMENIVTHWKQIENLYIYIKCRTARKALFLYFNMCLKCKIG